MSSEVIAAILGALLAGGFQTVVGLFDRRREADSVITAIASEVNSICRLIRHQRYHETTLELIGLFNSGEWQGHNIVIDIRQNYFSVYDGLVGKIGMLKPDNAARIVQFYSLCKSLMDSTLPDGVHIGSDQEEAKVANLFSIEALLRKLLQLGDEIVQLPRKQLPSGSSL